LKFFCNQNYIALSPSLQNIYIRIFNFQVLSPNINHAYPTSNITHVASKAAFVHVTDVILENSNITAAFEEVALRTFPVFLG
jgi:hypothetical protein